MKQLLCFITIGAVTISSSTFAACVKPSGSYVGVGGGPGVFRPGGPANTLFPTVEQFTVSVFFGAGSATQVGAGTMRFVSKMVTQPATSGGASNGVMQISNTGTLAAQTVSAALPTTSSNNIFSTTTCTGIVTSTSTVQTKTPGTAGPWTSTNVVTRWSYTSSQNGSVLMVSKFSDDFNTSGYTIRLERP